MPKHFRCNSLPTYEDCEVEEEVDASYFQRKRKNSMERALEIVNAQELSMIG